MEKKSFKTKHLIFIDIPSFYSQNIDNINKKVIKLGSYHLQTYKNYINVF